MNFFCITKVCPKTRTNRQKNRAERNSKSKIATTTRSSWLSAWIASGATMRTLFCCATAATTAITRSVSYRVWKRYQRATGAVPSASQRFARRPKSRTASSSRKNVIRWLSLAKWPTNLSTTISRGRMCRVTRWRESSGAYFRVPMSRWSSSMAPICIRRTKAADFPR